MARYALIIGIAEYTGSLFKSLETPVQNANAIADILDRYGDFNQVRRLPFRREAGQKDLGKVIRKPLPNETLVQALQQFLHDADGSDVLIYYSGHGFTKLDQLSQTPEGYLAPSDCQVELNAAGQITAEKNGISLFGLNTLINQHTFNSLVVILDCCDSGAFLESGMIRRDVTAFGYQRDYYLITACRSASKAYEGEEYSLLTAAVLKGLSPANASSGSGRISGDRLFDVIGNELQNSRQEPIRMGWGRLITLVRYQQPSESAEPAAHSFNATNPYMGLKPFGQEQTAYFFGREQAVRALLDRLAENRFLAVIGPSGCGKSSLVKAGLLPELQGDLIPGSHDWQIEIITPGQYPLQVLTNALERQQANDKPIVLFVDQFEELFTLCPNEEEQRTFIKRLNEETNDPAKQTRIIVAMRGDFLDRCAKFQEAADLINSTAPTTYMVIPLTEAKLVGDLKDSITCPAALHGVSFEDGLVSRIVDDVVNQPGAMPLLQYALLQLWDNCIAPDRPSRQLTLQSYEAIEGVKGALQRWADQFYTNLSPVDQFFVKELISELVQIGDGGEVTRRRAPWERLRSIASSQEQLDRIIGRLVYQRLLVADEQTVEVAHEALLSESKLIQGWIEENRDSIRLQQRLEIYRHEWQEHDRSENYLLDSGRLAAIDEWMEKKQPRLMSVDQTFIDQSRERRDRQFQAQLEQERKLREEAEGRAIAELEKKIEAEARAEAEGERTKEAVARVKAERRGKRFAIATAACITAIAAFAGIQWRAADKGQIEALVTSSQAKFSLNRVTVDALIEALRAGQQLQQSVWFRGDPHLQTEVMQVLGQATYSVKEHNRLQGHSGYVQSVTFSPGGQTLATASFDKTAKLWSLEGKELHTLTGHTAPVVDISFSPDGQTIATASQDGTARLWDRNGNLLHILKGHTDYVWRVSFSPDKQTIATASSDKTVKLWDYQGNQRKTLLGHGGSVYSVRFNPSTGQWLATASDDKTVRLWDRPGKWLHTFQGHTAPVSSVNFSPDSQTLAAASDDKTVILWNVVKKNQQLTLQGHEAEVSDVIFSPDAQTIATASWDGTIRLWSRAGVPLNTLKGHQGKVNSLSFSHSVQNELPLLASASNDKTVKLWQSNPWLKVLTGHKGPVYSVDTSPDGKVIASASDDQTVKLWDVQTGRELHTLTGHRKPITNISFSKDGKVIASASDDQTVKLWDVQTGQELHTLIGHRDSVTKVSFSEDHNTIASASLDQTVRLWSRNGKFLGTLGKHNAKISGISISRDGETIATADWEGTVRLWKRDGTLQTSWKAHNARIYNLRFSPDSDMIATASEDNTVRLWNRNGQLLTPLEGHTAEVWGIAFSPDGQMIATASDDRTIKLWTRYGALVTTLIGHQDPVNSVSFSADGKTLVSASSDRTVLLWDIDSLTLNSFMSRGCTWLHDYLNTSPKDLDSKVVEDVISVCRKTKS